MTDHNESAKRPPASQVPELAPKEPEAGEADLVVGGSIIKKRDELQAAILRRM